MVQLNGCMKRFLIFGIGVLTCVSFHAHAAQTAQARLFCLSLRFQQGIYHGLLGDVTLDLSTISLNTPNGELEPYTGPDHASQFHMWDTFFEETIEDGVLYLDVLAFTDANSNGFADFFEVSQAVSGVSTGAYFSPVDNGTVRASWSRPAGSKDGTCVLSFTSKTSGPLGDFTHPFELIEYAGTMNYTPAATNVSGTLSLTQSGDGTSQLSGAFLFVKSGTNRFNELELQPGVWSNAAGALTYTNDTFRRDEIVLTNYYGYVEFDDGDLSTPDADYLIWFLSIDDSNDSNGNGIPDFSDDIGSANARPPLLTLTRGSTALSLSISGTLGRTHEVQQTTSLDLTNWTIVSSVTLTNDPQSVSLPLPTDATSFWRVRVL